VLGSFYRLLRGPPLPGPRLSQQQVRALVAQAVRAAQIDVTLGVLTMRRLDGRFTWIAKTATKGSGLQVAVDDATGTLGPVERWGIR
jgi:hypothetical protein